MTPSAPSCFWVISRAFRRRRSQNQRLSTRSRIRSERRISMAAAKESTETVFNRGTGLLVIEARHSNPNGDPDAESEPRTLDADSRGLISPVSFKRKLRDVVERQDGPVWREAARMLKLNADGDRRRYAVLESRGRDRDAIFKMKAAEFADSFWDGRIFGNTFLEDIKGKNFKPGEKDHFISTGVVQ